MYRTIGADGIEYGPVGAEELKRWIAEGRANANSPVRMEHDEVWRRLGEFPEFAGALAAARSTTSTPFVPRERAGKMDPATAATQPSFPMYADLTGGRSKLAVAGAVFGLAGLCCCVVGLPFSIIGLIFSCVGLSRINRTQLKTGRGLAIAGIVLGLVGLFVWTSVLVVGSAEFFENAFY